MYIIQSFTIIIAFVINPAAGDGIINLNRIRNKIRVRLQNGLFTINNYAVLYEPFCSGNAKSKRERLANSALKMTGFKFENVAKNAY